ncbi:uncharacterized protein DUF1501 [Chthoniobacter flavus]|nr:DUF1501 domain-containing protein [Chthoniobacter flavus]TCO95747.1 uncharacterized protein DUF1501 [Chthoniobacter flavus]
MSPIRHNCAGVSRRDFLQIGLGGTLGLGLCDLLRARAAAAPTTPAAKNVNCIMIWMDGGPSHYETFDPKPDAPAEIRGTFGTVPTCVPGVHFSETIPNLAKSFDKFTAIRSICHKDPNHGGGNHYMMTGAPTPVPVGCGAFVTFHPSFGSMVSYDRGVRSGLPAYMAMPSNTRSGGPNFLGGQHAPFVIGGDPNAKGFQVRDVVVPAEITEGHAHTRRDLRTALDRMQRFNDQLVDDPAVVFDKFYQQGFDLVSSSKAQAAFDISREDDKVRDRYGRNDVGQRMLLARRLVEVGVSWVTVNYGGWDDHKKLFETYKGNRLKTFDQGLSALLNDLSERGLMENTMVIALGEFGRTPKVNKDAGRDHWPFAMSVLMAGAGIPGGQIVGATDAKGYHASENVYRPEDFAASLYTKMGIDPNMTLQSGSGRPVQLVNEGHLIKELFV